MLQRDADKANVIHPKPDPRRSKSSNLLAIVGDHTKVHGKFEISNSIQIECEIGGQLRVGEKLVIGANGVVHADVETVDAIIYGEYEGDLVATGRVEITATGRVRGSIKTNSLIIAEGVHADVETVDAIIYGEYEGDLVATGRVEITATGRVRGSIKTNSLIIAEGALCNGRVALLQEPVAAAPPSRPFTPVHETAVSA